MGLFKRRKSRATRRAEARAIKAKAKLEAKLAAKNEARRIKAAHRAETKALKAQLRAQRDSDRAALKVAETQLKAVREGKLFSPTRIRRTLTVTRLLAPIVVPLAYRAAIAARGFLDERRADRLGCSAQPARPVLRARRAAVGPHRRRRADVATGRREEAQGRRDQAVRRRHDRSAHRPVGRGHRRREHADVASPYRPHRDRRTARRHRRRPDGPARRGLTDVPDRQSRCASARCRGGAADRGAGGGRARGGRRRAADGRGRGAYWRCSRRRSARWPRPSSRAADARVLLGLLAAGQLVGHLMLSAAGHSHARAGCSPAAAMLAAHAAGGRRRCALIAAGDRLCRAVSRAVRGRRADRRRADREQRLSSSIGADQPLRSALLLAASVSHRGPPVSLAR